VHLWRKLFTSVLSCSVVFLFQQFIFCNCVESYDVSAFVDNLLVTTGWSQRDGYWKSQRCTFTWLGLPPEELLTWRTGNVVDLHDVSRLQKGWKELLILLFHLHWDLFEIYRSEAESADEELKTFCKCSVEFVDLYNEHYYQRLCYRFLISWCLLIISFRVVRYSSSLGSSSSLVRSLLYIQHEMLLLSFAVRMQWVSFPHDQADSLPDNSVLHSC